jgi:serine/threonine-protein kinase
MTIDAHDQTLITDRETQPASEDDNLIACAGCAARFTAGPNFCPVCGTSIMGEAPRDPLLGMVVSDRYKILSVLGRGGMGVVYKCEHVRMGKAMAIKLLHGDLARETKVLERFRREAQAISRLSSPYTVSVFDYGTSDGLTYLVMELVEGEDLGRLLRARHHLAPTRAARIVAQACESLAEAHEKGIVHRDVKPENLLVIRGRDGSEQVKMLDFGLARIRDTDDRNDISVQGALLGTPYYMAPEVISGKEADARADIYAIGAMLYRCLVGVPPFTGSSPIAVLTKALTEPLISPATRRPDLEIPPELDALVCRCLAREPEARMQKIDDVRSELELFLSGRLTEMSSTDAIRAETVAPKKPQEIKVATRDEFEAFERRIQRGKLAITIAVTMVVLALLIAVGMYFLGSRREVERSKLQAHDSEVEPNNSPPQGTVIAANSTVSGRIGTRLSREQGDVDVFRLGPVAPGQWRLRAWVTPQPNIDTQLMLYSEGNAQPLFVARESAAGEQEIIAGVAVTAGVQYFLSLSEDRGVSSVPTENVSDFYALRYELQRTDDGLETEPNDRENLAGTLRTDRPNRGYIESVADVDFWCFAPGTLRADTRIVLRPPEGLDLELQVLRFDGRATETIDALTGAAEESVVLTANTDQATRAPCVVVRGSETHVLRKGDGQHTYELTAQTGSPSR